jgi:superfamily II DNA or RNA helicase
MTLAESLWPFFTYNVQQRGRLLARNFSVGIVEIGENYIEAVADPNESISIEWADNRIALECSCRDAQRNGSCAHAWAAVLLADKEPNLPRFSRNWKHVFAYIDHLHLDLESGASRPPATAPKPDWRKRFAALQQSTLATPRPTWPDTREIRYIVDVPGSHSSQRLRLRIYMRDPSKQRRAWNQLKDLRCPVEALAEIPDLNDRDILSTLPPTSAYNYSYFNTETFIGSVHTLIEPQASRILQLACRTGRCHLDATGSVFPATLIEQPPLAWEDGEPWQSRIRLDEAGSQRVRVSAELFRGEGRLDPQSVVLLLPGGLVFTADRVAPLDCRNQFSWIAGLLAAPFEAPARDAGELLAALYDQSVALNIHVTAPVKFERVELPLKPRFVIRQPERREKDSKHLHGEVFFSYGEHNFYPLQHERGVYAPKEQRFIARDRAAEKLAWDALNESGLASPLKDLGARSVYKLARGKLPAIVRGLVHAGWHVESEGKAFRTAVTSSLSVTSGIDWFDLNGDFDFGGPSANLPDLLRAIRNGDTMVPLSDGTYGLLPQDWIDRLTPLLHFGDAAGGQVRFRRNQAGLLDALLAAQPQTTFDAEFARARDELKHFSGIQPLPQPETFHGQLRDYQKDGLGWMEFLRRFGFGGCLADDMGVGKTAQVLAMLETRRAQGAAAAPSLVVVPRSLVFNWKQEAARFTPLLKVLDHTAIDRKVDQFNGNHVVLTTYGILRRDVLTLREIEFDYVVLDEAQAVKNAASESAKAVRLLKSRHRLALSGTPIENHLGELASLVDFLNPGMLGTGGPAQLSSGILRNPPQETRAMLAKALRPFILRRTKQQVARELPEKSEQTIFCEMKPAQRKLYDELRDYYRNSLLNRIASEGLAKSKIHVLEALLRLRQAACHPGLLDPKRTADPSTKMDTLLAQLEQVVEEGHKALVFSQFTSLLALLKPALDQRKITFEYLDGSTTDRQSCVERFQNDPACPLFLISLKAGGLGLNLTAAEYVYLLDPWWNPAVEAQAIDRTHRIGQTRNVFAYRLIAKDTVEEKVLQLQATKRDLANAIIGEDNSLIRDLSREDLELLLG